MKYQICIKRRKMNLRNVRYNAEMADYFKSLNSFISSKYYFWRMKYSSICIELCLNKEGS